MNVPGEDTNAFIDDSPDVVQFWNSIGNFNERIIDNTHMMTGPVGSSGFINVKHKVLKAKYPSPP